MKKFIIIFAQVIGYFSALLSIIAIFGITTKLLFGDPESVEQRLQICIFAIHILLGVTVLNTLLIYTCKSKLVKAGWPGFRVSLKWLGVGAMIGFCMTGGVIFFSWISGGGSFYFNSSGLLEYLRYVLPLIFVLFLAALGEEWIFRGYPMARLTSTIHRNWANILISLLFLVGHWGGRGWNGLTVINIFLFSLVNGAMRFTRGGIPAAWGFHFAWNSLHVLLGATLTGEKFQVPFIQFVSEGSKWLSGGKYGPEGGLGTTFVTILGLIFIYKCWLRKSEINNS
jgi:membrane protease YdiL (CAAX protease family)